MEILTYPDERLRIKARPIEKITDEVRDIAQQMIEMMHEARGVGLAATQVGIDKRLIIVNPDPDEGEDVAFLNPRIASRAGRVVGEEGCLSVPGIRANVQRAESAVLKATLITGEDVEIEGEGLLARIWQHEIDHLDGILFIDKVTPASRSALKRKLQDLIG